MERRGFVSGSILGVAAALLSESLVASVPVAASPLSGAPEGLPTALQLELPVIMDYTVLPSSVTAKAWTDASYCA